LDILVPFLEGSDGLRDDLGTIYVYQMPATIHLFA
jgi:hypothetical protein